MRYCVWLILQELQSRLLDENELEQKEPKKKKRIQRRNHRTNSTIDLTILHMNDHHSHLEQDDFDLRGDDVPPSLTDVDRLRAHYGGLPRLVSLVKNIQASTRLRETF